MTFNITLIPHILERHGIKYGTPEYHFKVKERNDLRREFDEMLGNNGVFIYPTHRKILYSFYLPCINHNEDY